MNKKWVFKGLFLASIWAGFLPVAAQESQGDCRPGEVGMVTGSTQGTYFRLGKDMQSIAQTAGINLCIRKSDGSVDNISLLNDSRENAALAIVQSDVLGHLKRKQDLASRQTAERLRLVFPFHNEEIHLFAQKDIQKIEDLQGKRVVVGKLKSGSYLTAINLLKILNVEPAEYLKDMSPEDAVLAVLRGQVDAMFYVGGKPIPVFSNLDEMRNPDNPRREEHLKLLKNVHFVPLIDDRILAEYQKSEIGPNDYKWLSDKITTAMVKAILISYDFSSQATPYFKIRCNQLAKLGKVMHSNMGNLKNEGSGYHTKWKEIDLDGNLPNWKLDSCSHPPVGHTHSGLVPSPDDGLDCIVTRRNCSN